VRSYYHRPPCRHLSGPVTTPTLFSGGRCTPAPRSTKTPSLQYPQAPPGQAHRPDHRIVLPCSRWRRHRWVVLPALRRQAVQRSRSSTRSAESHGPGAEGAGARDATTYLILGSYIPRSASKAAHRTATRSSSCRGQGPLGAQLVSIPREHLGACPPVRRTAVTATPTRKSMRRSRGWRTADVTNGGEFTGVRIDHVRHGRLRGLHENRWTRRRRGDQRVAELHVDPPITQHIRHFNGVPRSGTRSRADLSRRRTPSRRYSHARPPSARGDQGLLDKASTG